ncbi:AMSH-like ubiquitin thioesterase 3 isoform X1 [Cornus florida]|uniref:AMSH-like ubiquitin thioesterase 3 isoform X1 n=1 Tax=Cornus florida TaxID=4283 RepID=UPI0028A0C8E2|nr:AMSH-like ubiquitin thioesterase 3 isoform X1 [Cornus florida]XP_059628894.1 AMSH-like ubiquitin thioesterase 3 isoform X1 [Cornus florida]
MRPLPENPFNLNAVARKIDVDNRIALRNYYRIADDLVKQASIYRGERNIVDLYIILLRYSSLVSETIPFHRDYQVFLTKERTYYRKKLLAVLDELESLKPEFDRRVNEMNKAFARAQHYQLDGRERTYGSDAFSLEWPSVNREVSLSIDNNQPVRMALLSSRMQNNGQTRVLPSNSIDMQFQKLSVSLPLPKKETLSRHSILGPDGLQGRWLGPSAEIKVHYPSNMDLTADENSGLNQAGQYDIVAVKDGDLEVNRSTMESVLSLDDGRWVSPSVDSCPPFNIEARRNYLPLGNIRQPSPPPVLAQVQPDIVPISPSRVTDPKPGPANPSKDEIPGSNSYQHLHISVKMMEDFLRLAQANTAKNLETCGVLACWLTEKQGIPYYYTYNPKAGINFRLGKKIVLTLLVGSVLLAFF